uniref:Uncharacterized protein n=1 Tax=Arundo donax TaxID=35708 RepID=A0A0A9AD11_ARUDO
MIFSHNVRKPNDRGQYPLEPGNDT